MNSEDFRGKIHADLDIAYKWTQEWLFKVNIDKCLQSTIKSVRFTQMAPNNWLEFDFERDL